MVCEDANSKLVEGVTVADEKRFDDSCMQIWKLKFGHEAKFCSDFEHTRFGQEFEVEVQAQFLN